VEGHIKMKKKAQAKKPAMKPGRSTAKKKPAYSSQKGARKNPGIHPAIGSEPPNLCNAPKTEASSSDKDLPKKMPALQKKMKHPQVTGYYCTVATYGSHDIIRKDIPSMYMHVGTKAVQVLGYMAHNDTCIGGTGTIIRKTHGGELEIYQPECGHDCIGTETSMGQNYGGFESAIVKPLVPGSLVYTQRINPDAESDGDFVVGSADSHAVVITENGDISCTFTISSFHAMAKRPLRFVHLMRPEHPANVRHLESTAIMQRCLQHTDSLSRSIFNVDHALTFDYLTSPLDLSRHNHKRLKVQPRNIAGRGADAAADQGGT
jgi:hypothetical protein